MPQESTGFSPFELLYGRDVRGPLDVLKETWVSSKRNSQDVLSYVMLMRDRMSVMSDHVQENLKSAGVQQKKWYDKNARDCSFQAGEQVLVLLPTSKLTAQWQGPYQVVSQVGNVNYLVHMPDHRKKKRVLHINMLQKWHQQLATVFLAAEEMEQEEVPAWNETNNGQTKRGSELTTRQNQELEGLLGRFRSVFQSLPGHTTVTEHRIVTGEARPVHLAPYRIPPALRQDV